MIERFRLWLIAWLDIPSVEGLAYIETQQRQSFDRKLEDQRQHFQQQIDDLIKDYASKPKEQPKESDEKTALPGFTRFTTRRAAAQHTGKNPGAYRVPTPKTP